MGRISLNPREELTIRDFINFGKKYSREVKRALALLALHKGNSNAQICEILELTRTSIWRLKKKYNETGAIEAIKDKPRTGKPKKIAESDEAQIIALVFSDPPIGKKRWTLTLLCEFINKKNVSVTFNRESIRLILKKHGIKLR